MRRIMCSVLVLLISSKSISQTDDTLTVVNWNIEWFGSFQNGPSNENLQEANALKIMRYLNADIYALNEIVDSIRLKRVADSLGNYGYFISYFASAAATTTSPNWSSAQKLAYIYRKDVFSNIKTRAMLNNGSSAYYNFASGRFPYLFNANVSKGGKKRNISFIVIHAKAGATTSDYNRRKDGSRELKDTLDPFFSNHPMILLGDYNDELYTSIVNGISTSPYQNIVQDSVSTNSNYYHSITLPLGMAGERSTISFSNVIDHQVINKRMDSMYIPGSARIRTDVTNVVPDYTTRNTSDHYPVSSQFKLIAGDTSIVVINPPPPPPPPVTFTGFKAWPNPLQQTIIIRTGKELTNVTITLFNSIGQRVWQNTVASIPAQVFNEYRLPNLASGAYFFILKSREQTITLSMAR